LIQLQYPVEVPRPVSYQAFEGGRCNDSVSPLRFLVVQCSPDDFLWCHSQSYSFHCHQELREWRVVRCFT